MTDTNDKKPMKLTLGAGAKLKLNSKPTPRATSERGGSVKVEVIKKRRPLAGQSASDKAKTEEAMEQAILDSLPGGLTDGERKARLAALKKASQEAEKQKEEELRQKTRQEELELKRKAEEEEQRQRLEKAAQQNTKNNTKNTPKKEATVIVTDPADIPSEDKPVDRTVAAKIKERERSREKEEEAPASVSPRVRDERRVKRKITVTTALQQDGTDEGGRRRSLASIRRAREKAKRANAGPAKEKEKVMRDVVIPEVIAVQELANRMSERVVDVTRALMGMGVMASGNQNIDADTAEIVVQELGHRFRRVTEGDVEDVLTEHHDNPEDLQARAPVVTFMGHVDHGKTSLLDAIRKAKVAEGEAGGITQHIGAYQVTTDDGQAVTFLDTPGHEAFTQMRQRGAHATDIVVLVVAADDGIMEQTKEAIAHAKAAGTPIIVAINKIDKPSANPQKVRTQLLDYELIVESMGGDIMDVEVSAVTGAGIDQLLSVILLQSEVMELQANPSTPAAGVVVEAKLDKTRGPLATVLVQRGTLKRGDILVAGETFGRVRALLDAKGVSLEEALPSMPVEILGLASAPEAGVECAVVPTERQARDIIEYRQKRTKDLKAARENRTSLDDLFEAARSGGIQELPVVIKADVQGSLEAIMGSLDKLATSEVKMRYLHAAVGGISASDISLAAASRALVLGFNVRADSTAKEIAASEHIDIKYYSIIYNLIEDMKGLLSGMLKPEIREEYLGTVQIREVFNITKVGKVAGSYVTDGVIRRGAQVRLLRDNVVVHEGHLKTLRRFKDDVKEVQSNFECGIAFERYDDIKPGDSVEVFEMIETQRTL